MTQILAGAPHVVIEDPGRFGTLPTGAWDTPPRAPLAVPIVQQGEARPAGMLIAALNPFRPLNEGYTGLHRSRRLADRLRHRQCPRL